MSSRISRIADVATIIAAASAVVVGLVVVRQAFAEPPPMLGGEPRELEDWEYLVEGAHRKGPADASVVIVEFGDYECPACKAWHPQIDAILARYPEEVAFVFKHWPLSYHPYAYPAARAAECAGEQGRFWEFHEILYRDTDFTQQGIGNAAVEAKVADRDAFERCIQVVEPVPAIEADVAQAAEIGARGTPTVIVNGLMLGQQRDSLYLRELIEDASR